MPKYKGVFSGLKTVFQQEGFAGLYKGVHISAFVSAFASFCFFSLYSKYYIDTKKLSYNTNKMEFNQWLPQPMLELRQVF